MKKIFIIVVVIAVLVIGTTAFAADRPGRSNDFSEEDRLFQFQLEDCDGTCEDCLDGEERFYGQDKDSQERGYGMSENREDFDCTCDDCADGDERLYRQQEDDELERGRGRRNRS